MNKIWNKEDRQDILNKIILFLISPFIAFLYSLKRINTKSSYIVAFLFSVFFGLAFTVSNVRIEGSSDAISYRINFEQNVKASSFEYYYGLKEFLKFDDGPQDYYFETVCYYVSRVTDNYHVMFLVLAVVFAFFQLKALRFFTSNIEERTIPYNVLILLFLFTFIQIFNINGCRFWTAYWIAVYAMLQIFYNNKPQYILLAAITPFFHGSYWFYVAMLFVIYLLKKFDKIWYALFIISIFIGNIALQLAQDYSDLLPQFLARKAEFYTDDDYVKSRGEGTGFFFVQKFFDTILPIFISIFILYIYKFRDKLAKKDYALLQVLLVWTTVSNLLMSIPSLGGRFFVVSYPLIAILAYKLRQVSSIRTFVYLIPFVFFMQIYYLIFLYYGSVLDITFYISNPFYIIYNALT